MLRVKRMSQISAEQSKSAARHQRCLHKRLAADSRYGKQVRWGAKKPEESLRVVVAVDVDLGERVVHAGLGAALMDAGLEPWQQQLQPATDVHKPCQVHHSNSQSHHRYLSGYVPRQID